MTTQSNGFTIDTDGFILATNSANEASDVWRGGLRFRAADGAVRTALTAADFTQQGWPMVFVTHALSYAAIDPDHVQNGIPIAATGGVAAAASGTIDHWQNGLPFVGNRLAMKTVA